MRVRRHVWVAVACFLVLIGAASCGGGGTTPPPPPVLTTITVTVSPSSIQVGQTATASASGLDQNGASIAVGTVQWTTGNASVATVSAAGVVTGVGAGQAQIIATSNGKQGQASITVTAVTVAQCSSSTTVQMALGEIRTLTAAQTVSLCLGGLTAASEYVLIPFNNSNVAAQTTSIQLTSTNTVAVTAAVNLVPSNGIRLQALPGPNPQLEIAFRERERRDLAFLNGSARTQKRASSLRASTQLTGVPTNPTVGSIVQLNSNINGSTCSAPKIVHGARVVSVTQHVIVFIDTLAPTGGYTDAELAAFGTSFENVGYGLDTLNFGAPSDIDGNGRVGVFFTTGVNNIPSPAGGGFIAGLFAGRDLFPITTCIASNEGEMFYLPVPDPDSTLNGNYTSKSALSNTVLGTLVHEFQHLINAGRRIYVNNALVNSEEVWLNEGLSHIAEELLYYRESGNVPRSNLDLSIVAANAAQVAAINTYQLQNLGRLKSYLAATASNSPYAQNDNLPTRGAIWELLRYSADQRGGNERDTWFALVNSTTSGQANFNAVFGNIITNTRDWAVAQFVDDLSLNVPARYQNLSWNFRSILPAITTGSRFPLNTNPLVAGTPLSLDIIGGGAAYVRFRVTASTVAALAATSTGQPTPANIDFILVRTQ
ncbi:MAG: hypothetical protein JWM41_2238 [Gemmatimonadetes bacterium]|nr:hypothetical protein [Gemmatimonadota bacterium]